MIVLDASVAVKWFFPEAGSDAAIELLGKHPGSLTAPDLLVVEVLAALVRKANIDKTQAPGVLLLIDDFTRQLHGGAIELRRVDAQAGRRAARLAVDLGHPLKDCIYLALAMDLGCLLITADARFVERANIVYDRVRLLDEGA